MRGLWGALQTERNMRIHLGVAALVLLLSAWLRLTTLEWLLIVVAIALVFIGEMFNTVVEQVVDLIAPKQSLLAKRAKDIAAGAVLIAALASATIGLVIFGSRLWLGIRLLR